MQNQDPIETNSRIPDVFVVGAAKSGNTAIYHTFRVHPEIFVPEHIKELNFMGLGDANERLNGPGDRDVAAANPVRDLASYLQCYADRTNEPHAADVSPFYLYSPSAAAEIYERRADGKIMMILRHPARAAYSMFAMMRRANREPIQDFRQAFDMSETRINAGWEYAWDYKGTYSYSRQVIRYLDRFPGKNIFIGRYDDWLRDPVLFWSNMTNFLGLQNPLRALPERHNSAPTLVDAVNRGEGVLGALYRTGIGALMPHRFRPILRSRLERRPAYRMTRKEYRYCLDYFTDDIKDLGRLVEWDATAWLDSDMGAAA